MPDNAETIGQLKELVERFVAERNWQVFHSPKNLSMALAIEAAELMEHFQWLEPQESRAVADDAAAREAVAEELSDVICYALAIANEMGIDVADSLRATIRALEGEGPGAAAPAGPSPRGEDTVKAVLPHLSDRWKL